MIQRKICMLGAFAVGKSSLVRRYVENIFSDLYTTTIGVRIDKKVVQVADQQVSLVLWDIHGEDSYQNVLSSYVKGLAGYLLIIDPTRPYSVDSAFNMKELVEEKVGIKPFVVVLNKCDLKEQWQLTREDLPSWVDEAVVVLEASAKSDLAVNNAFQMLADSIVSDRAPSSK